MPKYWWVCLAAKLWNNRVPQLISPAVVTANERGSLHISFGFRELKPAKKPWLGRKVHLWNLALLLLLECWQHFEKNDKQIYCLFFAHTTLEQTESKQRLQRCNVSLLLQPRLLAAFGASCCFWKVFEVKRKLEPCTSQSVGLSGAGDCTIFISLSPSSYVNAHSMYLYICVLLYVYMCMYTYVSSYTMVHFG